MQREVTLSTRLLTYLCAAAGICIVSAAIWAVVFRREMHTFFFERKQQIEGNLAAVEDLRAEIREITKKRSAQLEVIQQRIEKIETVVEKK